MRKYVLQTQSGHTVHVIMHGCQPFEQSRKPWKCTFLLASSWPLYWPPKSEWCQDAVKMKNSKFVRAPHGILMATMSGDITFLRKPITNCRTRWQHLVPQTSFRRCDIVGDGKKTVTTVNITWLKEMLINHSYVPLLPQSTYRNMPSVLDWNRTTSLPFTLSKTPSTIPFSITSTYNSSYSTQHIIFII